MKVRPMINVGDGGGMNFFRRSYSCTPLAVLFNRKWLWLVLLRQTCDFSEDAWR